MLQRHRPLGIIGIRLVAVSHKNQEEPAARAELSVRQRTGNCFGNERGTLYPYELHNCTSASLHKGKHFPGIC